MRKIISQVIVGLILLPGFIFDVCLGIGFILNDGRADHHTGDFVAIWAVEQANKLPEFLDIPFMLTVWICALPAGAFCLGLTLAILIGSCWTLGNLLLSILVFPFTGKFKWGYL